MLYADVSPPPLATNIFFIFYRELIEATSFCNMKICCTTVRWFVIQGTPDHNLQRNACFAEHQVARLGWTLRRRGPRTGIVGHKFVVFTDNVIRLFHSLKQIYKSRSVRSKSRGRQITRVLEWARERALLAARWLQLAAR